MTAPNIGNLLASTQSFNRAVAVFSLPGEKGFRFLVQELSRETPASVGNTEFWISPFDLRSGFPFIRIRPDYMFDEASVPAGFGSEATGICWEIPHPGLEHFSEARFVNAVEEVKRDFSAEGLRKAVLSKVSGIGLPADFDSWEYLKKLREAYPEAFVSYFSTPFSGTWIGATPETLVRRSGKQLTTISLAGTRINSSGTQWTPKEREEQQLVTDYIRSALGELRLENIQQDGPHELKTGNLLHLRTMFSADIEQGVSAEDVLQMARKLHPTPAVGGLPGKEALERILAIEKYDRSYYAGFIGVAEPSGDVALFVNLRCMTLSGGQAYLFAGAGITSASDAVSEWKETENKTSLLSRFLS